MATPDDKGNGEGKNTENTDPAQGNNVHTLAYSNERKAHCTVLLAMTPLCMCPALRANAYPKS